MGGLYHQKSETIAILSCGKLSNVPFGKRGYSRTPVGSLRSAVDGAGSAPQLLHVLGGFEPSEWLADCVGRAKGLPDLTKSLLSMRFVFAMTVYVISVRQVFLTATT